MPRRPGKHSAGFGKSRLAALAAAAAILVAGLSFGAYRVGLGPRLPALWGSIAVAGLQGGGQAAPAFPRVPDSLEAARPSPVPEAPGEAAEAALALPLGARPDETPAAFPALPQPTRPAESADPAEPRPDPNLPQPNDQGLYSRAVLLQPLDLAVDLYALEADARICPASLSKMMTALVAIEHSPSLDDPVTLTADMFQGLFEAGASTAGFLIGETVTVRDLLYGAMLPSGADATNALAFYTAGGVEPFVALMNRRAGEIGMPGTHFTNTHGLHDDDLYSTCRDLAALLRCALENPAYREIFTTDVYVTSPTPEHPRGITLRNAMAAALGQNPLACGAVLGSKTGFTTPAGQCLASLAQVEEQEYILITVGAGRAGYNKQRYNMLDALTLYTLLGAAP